VYFDFGSRNLKDCWAVVTKCALLVPTRIGLKSKHGWMDGSLHLS
jgi:hypothetical protein